MQTLKKLKTHVSQKYILQQFFYLTLFELIFIVKLKQILYIGQSNNQDKAGAKSLKNNTDGDTQRKQMKLRIIKNWELIAECVFCLNKEDLLEELKQADRQAYDFLELMIKQYYRINWFSHNIQSLKDDSTVEQISLSPEMLTVVDDIYKLWAQLNSSKSRVGATGIQKFDSFNDTLTKCLSDYWAFMQDCEEELGDSSPSSDNSSQRSAESNHMESESKEETE